jgi:DNA-binding phage protein
MNVIKKYFPEILSDNEENYFAMVIGYIESIDEFASLQITKQKESYQFRLSPSLPRYTDSLVKEILRFHTLLGLHLNISKSIKTTGTIFFQIRLDNK